jgi:rubredoxin
MTKKKVPEFLKKIDFTELRSQKEVFLKVLTRLADDEHDKLEGILNLVDAIQDYAVDVLGVPEMLVFGFEQEENREIKPKTKTKIKTLWLCPNCGSDNVEMKVWAKANTNEITDDASIDEEDCYCNDCGEHGQIILSTLKETAKIEGYQVVNDEFGDIHPDMAGSFCLYNLSQAREMIAKGCKNPNQEWKLLAIWTGDVEEPTIMFSGNPRD